MVGLSDVDNTSDVNKPVSTAQQTALNLKAPVSNPTFTGTVSGITKSMIGLSNVDNTSDINKPVSTAQQTALALKAPLANPTFTGTVSGVTKSMVGLSDVDNTSDANKPVSTAQQAALDLKAPLANPTFTGTVSGVTKSMVGLSNVDNTSDKNKPLGISHLAYMIKLLSQNGKKNFTECVLADADFASSNLADGVFTYTDVSSATFASATLTAANFSNATGSNTNFAGANVTGGTFTNAQLTHANVTGTNLTSCNFTGADLSNSTLTGAIWTNAVFSNTNVTNTVDAANALASLCTFRTGLTKTNSLTRSTSNVSFGSTVQISRNGNRMAVIDTASFYITIFDIASTTGAFTQVGAPLFDTTITTTRTAMPFSLNGDGSLVAVGYTSDYGGATNTRIYQLNSGTNQWTQVGNSITFGFQHLSLQLSESGESIVVGSRFTSTNAGSMRVYQLVGGTTWTQVGSTVIGKTFNEYWGVIVQISDNGQRIMFSRFTKINVYELVSGTWTQLGNSIVGGSNEELGRMIVCNSDMSRIAVSNMAGIVMVLGLQSSTWTQIGSTISLTTNVTTFSMDMSGSGERLVMGNSDLSTSSGTETGEVRVYEWYDNAWTIVMSAIHGSAYNDHIGSSVSMSKDGTRAIVGSTGTDTVDLYTIQSSGLATSIVV
jgi:uncharacterized protein YjbI with pentapeptide repeats